MREYEPLLRRHDHLSQFAVASVSALFACVALTVVLVLQNRGTQSAQVAVMLTGQSQIGGTTLVNFADRPRLPSAAKLYERSPESASMLATYSWNGNHEYWDETPLDLSELPRHPPAPVNPTMEEEEGKNIPGVVVDSYGPLEAVKTSKPEKTNQFMVDQSHGHADIRSITGIHAGDTIPGHPKEIESDQFISEKFGSGGVLPFETNEPVNLQGARGDDHYTSSSENPATSIYNSGMSGYGKVGVDPAHYLGSVPKETHFVAPLVAPFGHSHFEAPTTILESGPILPTHDRTVTCTCKPLPFGASCTDRTRCRTMRTTQANQQPPKPAPTNSTDNSVNATSAANGADGTNAANGTNATGTGNSTAPEPEVKPTWAQKNSGDPYGAQSAGLFNHFYKVEAGTQWTPRRFPRKCILTCTRPVGPGKSEQTDTWDNVLSREVPALNAIAMEKGNSTAGNASTTKDWKLPHNLNTWKDVPYHVTTHTDWPSSEKWDTPTYNDWSRIYSSR